MNLKYFALGAIVGGSVLAAGCDDKTPAPATPAATPAASDMSVPPTMKNAQDQAKATVDAAESKMGAAGDQAAAVGDGVVAQAQKLYDDAKAAINKADFTGAQKYVDQLTALKSKLPADWQTKVDELSKMLADGKSKLGSMGAMPSMPK